MLTVRGVTAAHRLLDPCLGPPDTSRWILDALDWTRVQLYEAFLEYLARDGLDVEAVTTWTNESRLSLFVDFVSRSGRGEDLAAVRDVMRFNWVVFLARQGGQEDDCRWRSALVGTQPQLAADVMIVRFETDVILSIIEPGADGYKHEPATVAFARGEDRLTAVELDDMAGVAVSLAAACPVGTDIGQLLATLTGAGHREVAATLEHLRAQGVLLRPAGGE